MYYTRNLQVRTPNLAHGAMRSELDIGQVVKPTHDSYRLSPRWENAV